MATKDFRASQIETSKIIGTGSITGTKVSIAVYSGSIATNREGGTSDSAMFSKVGSDVFLFVSGTRSNNNFTRTGATLFGGDVVISGTLHGGSPLKIGGGMQVTGDTAFEGPMTFDGRTLFNTGFDVDSGSTIFQESSTFNGGLSGSLTQLVDSTSFIKEAGAISVVTQSNGSLVISSPNLVFNEYLGQGNNENTLFTLSKTPTAPKNITIYLNGVLQLPATIITTAPFQDYSATGSAIFFTTASLPEAGSIIMANYTTNELN